MDEPPIPLRGKSKRLRSLNEFDPPYWKGLFQPWKREGVPIWIVLIGLALGVAIGLAFL